MNLCTIFFVHLNLDICISRSPNKLAGLWLNQFHGKCYMSRTSAVRARMVWADSLIKFARNVQFSNKNGYCQKKKKTKEMHDEFGNGSSWIRYLISIYSQKLNNM